MREKRQISLAEKFQIIHVDAYSELRKKSSRSLNMPAYIDSQSVQLGKGREETNLTLEIAARSRWWHISLLQCHEKGTLLLGPSSPKPIILV